MPPSPARPMAGTEPSATDRTSVILVISAVRPVKSGISGGIWAGTGASSAVAGPADSVECAGRLLSGGSSAGSAWRIRVCSSRSERQHEKLPETLVQRAVGHGVHELGDSPLVVAQFEPGG